MTFQELINEVTNIVQDTAWSEAAIKSKLNQALIVVATGVMLPGKYQLSPPLPDLYTSTDIDTVAGVATCNLTSDFNRDVIQVVNSNGDKIPIEVSFRKFLSDYPEQQTGSVFKAAVIGNKLVYRDVPATAETLTVHYYKTPTALVNYSDAPSCLPALLHRPLLVGYVCKEIFSQIEDGIEGQKTNTGYWTQEFQQGLLDLDVLIPHDGDPMYVTDLEDRL